MRERNFSIWQRKLPREVTHTRILHTHIHNTHTHYIHVCVCVCGMCYPFLFRCTPQLMLFLIINLKLFLFKLSCVSTPPCPNPLLSAPHSCYAPELSLAHGICRKVFSKVAPLIKMKTYVKSLRSSRHMGNDLSLSSTLSQSLLPLARGHTQLSLIRLEFNKRN